MGWSITSSKTICNCGNRNGTISSRARNGHPKVGYPTVHTHPYVSRTGAGTRFGCSDLSDGQGYPIRADAEKAKLGRQPKLSITSSREETIKFGLWPLATTDANLEPFKGQFCFSPRSTKEPTHRIARRHPSHHCPATFGIHILFH